MKLRDTAAFLVMSKCVSDADGVNPAASYPSADALAAPAQLASLVTATPCPPQSVARPTRLTSAPNYSEGWPNAKTRHARPPVDDLRGALARNEFRLDYQPIVSATTGAIICCEALLRWYHPVKGLVSPSIFVPLAERTGLIGAVGAWVLDRACREAATWPTTCRVSVNVSPLQLQDPGFPDRVAAALAASGIPAHRLELELTEAVLIDDSRTTLSCIAAIHELGVSIALDDFGIGYSSLSYLQRFTFDRLKIDRFFVQALSERPESQIIIRAICDLAQQLGLAVTAEGVENAGEAEILREIGCDELQGFLFSRPIGPAAASLLAAEAPQASDPSEFPWQSWHNIRRHALPVNRLPREEASDHA